MKESENYCAGLNQLLDETGLKHNPVWGGVIGWSGVAGFAGVSAEIGAAAGAKVVLPHIGSKYQASSSARITQTRIICSLLFL